MPTIEVTTYRERERPIRRKISSSTSASDLANLRTFKVAKVSLAGTAVNGFPFTWQNPEPNVIIIHEIIIRITTKGGTPGALLNVDVVATAADTSNTIYNALDLDAAANIYSSHNVADSGAAGDEKPHVVDEKDGANDWVTGKCTVQACTGLVGAVYIFYTEV